MSGELHMLPVKAGDATLIVDRTPERPFTVLIDAGLTDQEIIAYLHSVGVFHLDLVVLSHPDLDPLQGLLAVVDNPLMSIGKIWCFDLGFLREFVTTGILPKPLDQAKAAVLGSLRSPESQRGYQHAIDEQHPPTSSGARSIRSTQ